MREEEAFRELGAVGWPRQLGARPLKVSSAHGSSNFILQAVGSREWFVAGT